MYRSPISIHRYTWDLIPFLIMYHKYSRPIKILNETTVFIDSYEFIIKREPFQIKSKSIQWNIFQYDGSYLNFIYQNVDIIHFGDKNKYPQHERSLLQQ